MPYDLPPIETQDRHSKLHILHLEDSATDAEPIAWTLRHSGIPCHITRVGNESALADAVQQGGTDLIRPDSSIAGFSGAKALEMARARNLEAPIAFVSGHATIEMRNEAASMEATDFLSTDHRTQLVFLVQRA